MTNIEMKQIEILNFAKERIKKEIHDKFLFELHINGRIYDDMPKKEIVGGGTSVDKEIIIMIDSYVDYTINEIINQNFYLTG